MNVIITKIILLPHRKCIRTSQASLVQEKFEHTKWLIRSNKSQTDGQCNDLKKQKDNKTNDGPKTRYRKLHCELHERNLNIE